MLETFVLSLCLASQSLEGCQQLGAAYYKQSGLEKELQKYYRDEYKYVVAVGYFVQNKELYVPINRNWIYRGHGLTYIKDF